MTDVRIGVVTGSRVGVNGDGSAPGRILQVSITDANDTQNVQTCQSGDEYNPPNGAAVVIVAGGNSYKVAAALDDGIAPVMAPGGKRIYATDTEGAAEVAEIRLHPDGAVEVMNGEVALTLHPDGAVTLANGAGGATLSPAGIWTFHGTASHFDHPVTMAETLAVAGAVTSAVSVTAPQVVGTTEVTFAGKPASTHHHSGVQTGSGETGGPV